VSSLDKRYVLTERFSNREICEKNGEDGDVEWMPGYPVDTNVGADDGEAHSLDTADNLMSTREALVVIGNLLLMFVAAAGIGGATFFLGRSVMPEMAPLVAVFAVVFFVHSFLVESVARTIFVFILAAAVAWLAIRYIPVFEVSYSLRYQIAGDAIGFLIGLATGKPLAYIYRKIEDR